MTITEIEYNGRRVEVLHDLDCATGVGDDGDVLEYRGIMGMREVGTSPFVDSFVHHEVVMLVSRKLMENY